MPPQRLSAVLDANVLYPQFLRDVVMQLAFVGLFAPVFSARIHDEWMRNLLANRPDLDLRRLERTRDLLNGVDGAIVVVGYERLEPMFKRVPEHDRHVAAAAAEARATHIVTSNVGHFPESELRPFDIVVRTPDDFLCELCDHFEPAVSDTLTEHRIGLRNPGMEVSAYRSHLVRAGLVVLERRLAY